MKILSLFTVLLGAGFCHAQILFQDSFETYETGSVMNTAGESKWQWWTGPGDPFRPKPTVIEATSKVIPTNGEKMLEWYNHNFFGGATFYAQAPVNDFIKKSPAAYGRIDFSFAEGEQGNLGLTLGFYFERDQINFRPKEKALQLFGWGGILQKQFDPKRGQWYSLEYKMDLSSGKQAYFLNGDLLFERTTTVETYHYRMANYLVLGQNADVRNIYPVGAPGVFLDNCMIAAVPEPSVIAILCSGLAIFARRSYEIT